METVTVKVPIHGRYVDSILRIILKYMNYLIEFHILYLQHKQKK